MTRQGTKYLKQFGQYLNVPIKLSLRVKIDGVIMTVIFNMNLVTYKSG